MKSIGIVLLIAGFVGIAVFGFLAINHGNGHEHAGCIATTAKGIDCPLGANTILFAIFHLDIIKSFSTAIFNYDYSGSLILLAFIIFLVGWITRFKIGFDLPALAAIQYRHCSKETYFFPLRQNLTGWLALHENSPAGFL